jgi:hypothetical protein
MSQIKNTLRFALVASALSLGALSPVLAQTATPLVPAPSSTPTPPIIPALMPDTFYSGKLLPTNWLASDTISTSVHNLQKEKIGEVNDLIIDGDGRVVAAVIGIGGFLGMGEKDVAITFSAIRMTRDEKGKAVLALDVSKEALKAAPTYKPMTLAKKS